MSKMMRSDRLGLVILIPMVMLTSWLVYMAIVRMVKAEDIGFHSAQVLNIVDLTSDLGRNVQVQVRIDDGRTGRYNGTLTLLPKLGEVICVHATAVPGGGLVALRPVPMARCEAVDP